MYFLHLEQPDFHLVYQVLDFLKRQSVIKISKSGIERLGPSVINLANYENLHGHASSVKMRIKKGRIEQTRKN